MFTGNSKQCLEFPVLHAAKTSRRMKEAWRKSIICNKPLQAALHAGIVFTPPLTIDIGGIDRRLLYRSLDASRDILKIQDGGRKRAKSSSDLSNIGK